MVAWLTTAAHAQTAVCSLCAYTTIQGALDAGQHDLLLGAETFDGSIDLVGADLILTGDPAGTTIVGVALDQPVIRVADGDLTLTTLTVDGGGLTIGVVADQSAWVELTDVVVQNGLGGNAGGGVTAKAVGQLTLTRGSISDSHATLGGGLMVEGNATVVTIDGTTFLRNHADGAGSAAYLTGSALTVRDAMFDANTGPATLYLHDAGLVTVTDSRFTGCDGPAIEAGSGVDDLVLDGAVFDQSGTRSRSGGAVAFRYSGSLVVRRSWFCANEGAYGGAIEVAYSCEINAPCSIETSVFQDNAASSGGGAVSMTAPGGLLTIDRTTFVDNDASGWGDALSVWSGTAELSQVILTDGSPAWDPGTGVYVAGLGDAVIDSGIVAVSSDAGYGDASGEVQPPVFMDGYVLPACGDAVTLDWRSPDNDPAWLDWAGTGVGAHTDPNCGPECDDADADSWPAMWDCADGDATAWPGSVAAEAPGDGIDQDCDGHDLCYVDLDGDGYGDDAVTVAVDVVTGTSDWCTSPGMTALGGDCDDADATRHPGAEEVVADGIDQDCDDKDLCYEDTDQDGYADDDRDPSPDEECTPGGDCDDHAVDVYPGAREIPGDGIDQDCDGLDATGPGRDVAPEEVLEFISGGGACGCAARGHVTSGWALVLLGAAVRRRRHG